MTMNHQVVFDGTNPKFNCRCVTKHVPRAMELHRHHVWPVSEGGPDTPENQIILCPSTHSNIHRLWRLYEEHGGRPPWEILRKYSEYARAIVEKGRELRRAGTENTDLPSEEPEISISQ